MSIPEPQKKRALSYNTDDSAMCTDEDMEEIRVAMCNAFNPKPSHRARHTAFLAANDKWKWAIKNVKKKQRFMKMMQAMGNQSDISLSASNVIASSKQCPDIQRALEELRESKWGFNVFTINHEYPLTIIGHQILIHQKQCHQQLDISEQKLITFLYRIESEYKKHPNSYHSHYHAADVLVTMNWCLNHSSLIRHNLNGFEQFAMLIAAIIHDVAHNGRTNQFHIDTKSDLAITYHDVSPQENYHISTAMRCLYRADSNWTSSMSSLLEKEMKHILTQCVLNTDMRHHTSTVDSIADLLKELNLPISSLTSGPSGAVTVKLNDKQRMLVMHSLLHFCDISNPMKPFRVALQWGFNVYAEFFDQGDEEMKIGLTKSPLCDRENSDILKGQIGFSKFVVKPMLDSMLNLFPEFESMDQCLERNCEIYSQVVGSTNRPPNDLQSLEQFFAKYDEDEEMTAPITMAN